MVQRYVDTEGVVAGLHYPSDYDAELNWEKN